MTHALTELNLKPIVKVISIEYGHLGSAHKLVDDRKAGACLAHIDYRALRARDGHQRTRAWPTQALRRRCGQDHVVVISLKSHVHAARSHVADHEGGAGAQLALHVQVPLHDVITLRLEFHNVIAVAGPGVEVSATCRGTPKNERACRQAARTRCIVEGKGSIHAA